MHKKSLISHILSQNWICTHGLRVHEINKIDYEISTLCSMLFLSYLNIGINCIYNIELSAVGCLRMISMSSVNTWHLMHCTFRRIILAITLYMILCFFFFFICEVSNELAEVVYSTVHALFGQHVNWKLLSLWL